MGLVDPMVEARAGTGRPCGFHHFGDVDRFTVAWTWVLTIAFDEPIDSLDALVNALLSLATMGFSEHRSNFTGSYLGIGRYAICDMANR